MRNNGKDALGQKHGAGKAYKTHKTKQNIWTYAIGNVTKSASLCHPAKFPDKLPFDHVLSWSSEQETILDPFAGSGTTGVAAINTNRNAILIERDPKYCEIIRQRIAETEKERLQKGSIEHE